MGQELGREAEWCDECGEFEWCDSWDGRKSEWRRWECVGVGVCRDEGNGGGSGEEEERQETTAEGEVDGFYYGGGVGDGWRVGEGEGTEREGRTCREGREERDETRGCEEQDADG